MVLFPSLAFCRAKVGGAGDRRSEMWVREGRVSAKIGRLKGLVWGSNKGTLAGC